MSKREIIKLQNEIDYLNRIREADKKIAEREYNELNFRYRNVFNILIKIAIYFDCYYCKDGKWPAFYDNKDNPLYEILGIKKELD